MAVLKLNELQSSKPQENLIVKRADFMLCERTPKDLHYCRRVCGIQQDSAALHLSYGRYFQEVPAILAF
jgi:hypothetical protein